MFPNNEVKAISLDWLLWVSLIDIADEYRRKSGDKHYKNEDGHKVVIDEADVRTYFNKIAHGVSWKRLWYAIVWGVINPIEYHWIEVKTDDGQEISAYTFVEYAKTKIKQG